AGEPQPTPILHGSFSDLNICHKLNDKTLSEDALSEIATSVPATTWPSAPTGAAGPEYVPRESLQPLHAPCSASGAASFYAGNRGRDQPRLLARQPSAASRLLYSSSIGAARLRPDSQPEQPLARGWERELLGKRTSICCWRRGFMVKHDDGPAGDSGVELGAVPEARAGTSLRSVCWLTRSTCCWTPGSPAWPASRRTLRRPEDDGESNADEGLVGGATSGLMRRLVPCPECLSSLMDGGYVSLSALSERVPDWRAKVHWFGYRLCAERALTSRPLRCPLRRAPEPRSLVPELLFADVDRSPLWRPDGAQTCGGSPTACWARVPLAASTGPAAKISKFLENFVDQQQQQTDEPSSLRLLSGRRGSPARGVWKAPAPPTRRPRGNRRRTRWCSWSGRAGLNQAIDGLKRMRHEANVLQALRSPFLVAFRGICLEPLCFLTELAPLALWLRCARRRASSGPAPPCRWAATQLQDGVRGDHRGGLHALLSVLYRDLKSDNVLVFSKDPAARLHVKLGDYGTSLNTGLQGTTQAGRGPRATWRPSIREENSQVFEDRNIDQYSGQTLSIRDITEELQYSEELSVFEDRTSVFGLRDATVKAILILYTASGTGVWLLFRPGRVDVYSFGMVLYELHLRRAAGSASCPAARNLTRWWLDGGHPEFTVQEAEQAAFMGSWPSSAGVSAPAPGPPRWHSRCHGDAQQPLGLGEIHRPAKTTGASAN
uniref:Protein kinase domain-containing protein n=1 Tax=Macrostomum lignano TaxID=282301 RepID=A0A1I8FCM4_9PLAT